MRNIMIYLFMSMLSIYGYSYGTQIQYDTLNLDATEIKASRLQKYMSGTKIDKIDTLILNIYQNKSLAELVGNQSTIYVKTYGSGSLASLSIRGTSSSENAVLWNGLNMNSTVLGDFDLSNIPVFLFDNIELQYGGAGSLYGSAIIGGSIRLSNDPDFKKKISAKAQLSAGSFSNYGAALKFTYGNEKIETSTAINYKIGKNDYYYHDGQNKKRMTNSSILQYGIMEDLSIKTTDKSYLKASLWYQSNDKQIPPTMVMESSQDKSQNKDFRTSLQWRYIGKVTSISVKGGYFHNRYKYIGTSFTDDSGTSSNVKTNSGIIEIECDNKITSGFTLNTGISAGYYNANQEVYGSTKEQIDMAIFISGKYIFQKIPLELVLNLRQQFVDWKIIPLTPSFGLQSFFWKSMFIKGSVSTNYRTPTFNERYWSPGGNPNIKPESSINEDIQIGWKSDKLINEISITGFNSNIKDKIIWRPVSGTIWSPDNVAKVWSKGIETTIKLRWKSLNCSYFFDIGYTYISSTNETKNIESAYNYKKQLIYTPKHNGYLNFNFCWRFLEFNYNQKITSKSYTTSDNKEWVNGYSISAIVLAGNIKIKECLLRISGSINNLFDSDYQVIQYYPMPGINYEITLQFKY